MGGIEIECVCESEDASEDATEELRRGQRLVGTALFGLRVLGAREHEGTRRCHHGTRFGMIETNDA